jgi:hypothetical protein
MLGGSRVAAQLVASEKGLSSGGFVTSVIAPGTPQSRREPAYYTEIFDVLKSRKFSFILITIRNMGGKKCCYS